MSNLIGVGGCSPEFKFGVIGHDPIEEPPVKIARVVRRMRGGSQAQLVQGEDGHILVSVRWQSPRQQDTHQRVDHCLPPTVRTCVSVPPFRILELPASAQLSDDLHLLVANKRILPQGVLHLGSQCPVDPEQTAIFDFLPDRVLPAVRNLAEFATMFVFDHWVGQTDKRQAVFVRDRKVSAGLAFRAYFIDHGMAFDGDQWDYAIGL